MEKEKKTRPEKSFDFHKMGAIIQKNYIVLSRDTARLLPALLFPIVIMLVLGFATGNAPKHITTTIVVHDNSPLSQSIIQAISGSEYFSVTPLVSTEGEARKLLDEGKVSVIVEIPPNLQENINNNIPVNIVVIVDESDSAVAATSRSVLQGIIRKISFQVSEEKFHAYQQSVSSSAQSMNYYINNLETAKNLNSDSSPVNYLQHTYNQDISSSLLTIQLFSQANPQDVLQPLVYEEKPAYGTGRQPLDFAIPALIAMTIFQGAVMGMGRAVAGEKREGSLTRVFLTPTSNITIISGTLLFYIIFEIIRAAFLLLVSITLFNVTITGNYILISLVLLIYVSICTSIGMLISAVVKTEQQFQGIALLLSLPIIFLSGVFFPVQAMPRFMQAIANVLPVTYAADALRSVMVKGLGISVIIYPLIILMIFLVITLAATVVLFRRDIE
jgi:ABC-2 type transport system permease protein